MTDAVFFILFQYLSNKNFVLRYLEPRYTKPSENTLLCGTNILFLEYLGNFRFKFEAGRKRKTHKLKLTFYLSFQGGLGFGKLPCFVLLFLIVLYACDFKAILCVNIFMVEDTKAHICFTSKPKLSFSLCLSVLFRVKIWLQ